MNNKLVCLLASISLGIGAISLAAYSASKENKDIENNVSATGENIFTISIGKTGNLKKISDSFSFGGGTLSYDSQKNSSSTNPEYQQSLNCIKYSADLSSSHFGGGATLTFTNLIATKITLVATSISYNPPTSYKVNGGADTAGVWDETSMTISNINATSFVFFNHCEDDFQLRITQISIEYSSTADFNAVSTFVSGNMHTTDVGFNDEGKGLCRTANWYIDAKKELVKLSSSALNVFKTNSYFAKYHERYLAWADANKDKSPYEGEGIVLSNNINNKKNDGNNGYLVTSIISLSFSFILFSSLIYQGMKNKEE